MRISAAKKLNKDQTRTQRYFFKSLIRYFLIKINKIPIYYNLKNYKLLLKVWKMLLDLHNHTAEHSACSKISMNQLVNMYIDAGCDAICITDHNVFWSLKEMKFYIDKYSGLIKIFFGAEVDTDIGHVLVFGEEFRITDRSMTFSELESLCNREKTAFIWAHPLRWVMNNEKDKYINEDFLKKFDAIELFNGNLGKKTIQKTYDKMSLYTSKFTGSSDTHSFEMGCKYGTWFNNDKINTIEDLVNALKNDLFYPVDFLAPRTPLIR